MVMTPSRRNPAITPGDLLLGVVQALVGLLFVAAWRADSSWTSLLLVLLALAATVVIQLVEQARVRHRPAHRLGPAPRPVGPPPAEDPTRNLLHIETSDDDLPPSLRLDDDLPPL